MNPALLTAPLALVLTAAAQDISVTVDGAPVSFAGQAPVRTADGTVLVPLRGIFEKLGAEVRFVAATRTITATRGEISVLLRLGEAVGYVNRTPVPLAVPAQTVGGATLVPLRFVSEAFGASVKWDPVARVVAIAAARPVAPAPVGNTVPVNPPAVQGPITGVVASVDAAAGGLEIRTAAGIGERIALAPGAVVLVSVGGGEATRRDLTAVRPGDQASVKARDADGRALVLETAYGEQTGVVRAAEADGENRKVTLDNGVVVTVLGNAPATRRDPQSKLVVPIALADLRPGDRVTVRTSPGDGRGTALAVLPAEPVPVPTVEIVRVFHNAPNRWLRAGDTLAVTVDGTPGAQGTLRVPGLNGVDAIPLIETTPGRYTVSFPLPAGTVSRDLVPIATLAIDTTGSKPVAAPEPFFLDGVAPQPGTVAPQDGSEGDDPRPQLTGTYADTGTGIDARKVQLLLDGADVTAQAVVSDSFFSFKPAADLSAGRHAVTLVLRDNAGNETRRAWGFSVRAAVPIRTIRVRPDDRALDFGDVVTFTVEGMPAARSATVAIGPKISVTLREDSPGVYVGSYTLRRDDALTGAAIVVKLALPDGRVVEQTLERKLTLTAGAPDTPVIDLPQEGASVGNSVVLSGRTLPNATVRIAVRYQGKRGGLLNASGAIADLTVTADARGRWATDPILLKLPREVSGALFTAEVTAVGTGGSASAPATVRFKK